MARSRQSANFYRADNLGTETSVGYLMKRVLNLLLQQADRRLAAHDLTHAQWLPMMKLRHGSMAVAELARELNIDAGATTRLVDRLEKKGLCKRVRSLEDRRVVNLALTAEGEAAAALVPGVLVDGLNGLLAGFSRAEWQTLMEYLNRMVENGEAMRDAE